MKIRGSRMRSSRSETYSQIKFVYALRSIASKEFLHEGWTMGAAGNGCASRIWKGWAHEGYIC
jgi:hypothetical protein